MTRVALVGNFSVSFTTESHLKRAFIECGCDAEPFQIEHVVADPNGALDAFRFFDLILYVRTHSRGRYLDQRWTDRWRALEDREVRTAGFHLDRYFDLQREHLIHDGDAQFTVGTFFSADGGSDDKFAAAGVNHHWLPPAVDRYEAEQMPGRYRAELADDVAFVGSSGRTYHAEYSGRTELLEHLRATYGTRFVHYGHGGDRPVVRQQELNDVYASAKVVVGDSCFANEKGSPRSTNYWSDRCAESTGRRGVLLHPYVPGLRDWHRHVLTYNPGDWNDLDTQIGVLLQNEGMREQTREVTQMETLARNTYTHRMAELLRVVGLAAPVTAASE